ncbi:hypothetical protein QUF58_11470 [Anaerolineales bacterium HSG24]|nr:hypothetical protein [Anaerolineales bacterium HSG24]
MIIRVGRVVATVVAIVSGLFVLTDLFVAQWSGELFGIAGLRHTIEVVGLLLVSWAAIIVAFALLLGLVNVISVHANRIRTKQSGAVYSGVLLISLLLTLLIGMDGPMSTNTQFLFNYILYPLESTFSALLALFIATAAFRAFRIRDMESSFFVLFAIIVLLGQLPIGIYLWDELPVIKDWIMTVPTMAGVRGILLGVALGTIATGIRILIGTDRPYAD